jgi:hypothetical protein
LPTTIVIIPYSTIILPLKYGLKSTILREVTPCNPVEFKDVSEEHTASIFRVEQAASTALQHLHHSEIPWPTGWPSNDVQNNIKLGKVTKNLKPSPD